MKIQKFIIVLALFMITLSSLEGGFVIRNGKIFDEEYAPMGSPEDHFIKSVEAFNENRWKEVVKHSRVITYNYPKSDFAKCAWYNLGVGSFYTEEYEEANLAFSEYLKCQNDPQYFEEVFRYKLAIANEFSMGARRHMFGVKQLPKWVAAYPMAEEIYEEIIAVIPAHELAAQALFSKASHHWRLKEYRVSVDTYQTLIRRFPKHPLAADSYVLINKVFLDQSAKEYQNPDLIAMAELNAKKFQADFPGEERILDVQCDVIRIKENYAHGLYEVGTFYERSGQPCSSLIYYQNAVKQFPETQVAEMCRKRIYALGGTTD